MPSRIYSKVSLEMWGDKKFCALSPLRPSGQALWIYLLTGKFRTAIPGLILNNVGIGALAERLGWSERAVKAHWQELADLGMATADWQLGVVWLPHAIEHNEPESPNVIRGWGKLVLPECALVAAALESLRAYIRAHLTEGFREAFEEAFGQTCPNQEQEQEQENPPLTPPRLGGLARKPTKAEEEWAAGVRRAAGCQHDPACTDGAECIGKLVMRRRLGIRAGMDSILAVKRA